MVRTKTNTQNSTEHQHATYIQKNTFFFGKHFVCKPIDCHCIFECNKTIVDVDDVADNVDSIEHVM